MNYDPIKKELGKVFGKSLFLRKLFYRLLDVLLLRAWHIHRELLIWYIQVKTKRSLLNSSEKENELNILDAGAGFGQYSYWMWKKFKRCHILSVDVKEEQIRDCQNFFSATGAANVRFEKADLTKFVQPAAFNLVLCVDVMEHIEEDVLVFKNFYSSMKEGGMLLISTPSDQGGSDAGDSSDESFIGEHVRNGYNVNEIENKLRSAGFSNIITKYSYGKPGNISWRISMKYPILMLGISRWFFVLLPVYYAIAFPVSALFNFLDVRMNHSTGTGLIVKAYR